MKETPASKRHNAHMEAIQKIEELFLSVQLQPLGELNNEQEIAREERETNTQVREMRNILNECGDIPSAIVFRLVLCLQAKALDEIAVHRLLAVNGDPKELHKYGMDSSVIQASEQSQEMLRKENSRKGGLNRLGNKSSSYDVHIEEWDLWVTSPNRFKNATSFCKYLIEEKTRSTTKTIQKHIQDYTGDKDLTLKFLADKYVFEND